MRNVTPLQIFERYCPVSFTLGRPFCSPFRNDKSPSAVIYPGKTEVHYRDFASGENYNWFDFVRLLYNLSPREVMRVIARDFNVRNGNYSISKARGDSSDASSSSSDLSKLSYQKRKRTIDVVPRGFNLIDVNYWGQFGIELEDLVKFNVSPAKEVWLDGNLIMQYRAFRPIYAYKFIYPEGYSYKIYSPYAEKHRKWLFNGTSDDIEGYDMLPWLGDKLVITKSLKDVMCLYKLGVPAISLQGEANKLEYEFLEKLRKRFTSIYVLYDNDTTGRKGANRLKESYGLSTLFIPEESGSKDISEFTMNYSLESAKDLLSELIDGDL